MHDIAKTFLVNPCRTKWLDFENGARPFFQGVNPLFDRLMAVIREFHADHDMVPNLPALRRMLHAANDRELVAYVEKLLQDNTIGFFPNVEEFAAGVSHLKQITTVNLIKGEYQKWETAVASERALYPGKLDALNREFQGGLQQIQLRVRSSDSATALLLHGEEAVNRMRDRYDLILQRKEEGQAIFYTLPFSFFKGVRLTAGDFLTIVGYTSHCKSVLAREVAYKLLIEDGLNVAMWSTEMPGGDVELLFALRHANNKKIFPGTPKISFASFSEGKMTPEQADFFFKAHADFVSNEAYGTLHVEQPASPDFNLGDLSDRCLSIERTIMPIHVVVVDYLSQLNPLPHGVRSRGDNKADVNRMFAQFRLFCLTYTSLDGSKAPLIGISPAQISRGKMQEAIKNDNMYDSDAPSDFNEIERSSTAMLSTLMTREMRAEGRLRLQVLKNRMGEVPTDAFDVFVAMAYGMTMQEFAEPDADTLSDRLAELDALDWGGAGAVSSFAYALP